MTEQVYCKIVDGAIVARQVKDNPEVATGQDGNPIWRPYIRNDRPSYDPATQHPPVSSDVIGDTQVTQTWADPVDKTAQELDQELTQRAVSATDKDLARLLKLLMSGQFAIVKEMNGGSLTVNQYLNWLDNNPSLSDAEFRAKMKALLA